MVRIGKGHADLKPNRRVAEIAAHGARLMDGAFNRMRKLYFSAHVPVRFLFSLALLLAVAGATTWAELCALLVLAMLVVRMQYGSRSVLLRAGRLLLWLVIPIIILHSIYTPGRLLWPESGVPVSREGVLAGCWLALRLAALFGAAMALSRALTHREWLNRAAGMPLIGRHLAIYIRLAGPLRALVMRQLGACRIRPLTRLPETVAALIAGIWIGAGEMAGDVWREWEHSAEAEKARPAKRGIAVSVVCGLLILHSTW